MSRTNIIPRVLLSALCLHTLACTEPPDGEVGTSSSPLLIAYDTPTWAAHGNVIPVCFLNGSAALQHQVRTAVDRTWTTAAAIRFDWLSACPFSGSAQAVRVSVRAGDGTGSAGSAQVGMHASSLPHEQVWCANAYGTFVPCKGVDLVLGSSRAGADFLIVHEFGHVLGFEHEFNRAEAEARECMNNNDIVEGWADGPYNPESIMSYCGGNHGFLTEGDRASVREFYGARVDRRDVLTDLDGDSRSEPIATNLEGSYALTSTGTTFNGFHAISAPFYGQRETLYGDVNGDGQADGVAVNPEGVYVALSNGYSLSFDGAWASFAFYGARRTLLADVNGDGMDDLVAINPEAAWVLLSTGTGFAWDGAWCADCYGDVQTDLADVTGDGRADLIANRGKGGMWVAPSNGNGFEPLEHWGLNGLRADFELAFGDVDGDGRADAIAVLHDRVMVRRSLGWTFLSLQPWTTGPFYGTRATRFADVTGDGRVDIVAINDDRDYVGVSNGTAFVPAGAWTAGPFYSMAP